MVLVKLFGFNVLNCLVLALMKHITVHHLRNSGKRFKSWIDTINPVFQV